MLSLHNLIEDKNDLPLDAEIERLNDTELVIRDLCLVKDKGLQVTLIYQVISSPSSEVDVLMSQVAQFPYYSKITTVANQIVANLRVIEKESIQQAKCLREQIDSDNYVNSIFHRL